MMFMSYPPCSGVPRNARASRAGLASRRFPGEVPPEPCGQFARTRDIFHVVGDGDTQGRTVGGFQVLEQLGEGGMGTVYRARQIALDREVALKLLRPGSMSDQENAPRFQREMQIAAGLAHPGLVRVLDGGTADGSGYIAMELVRGKTLVDLIVEAAPLAWPLAVAVIARVAAALAYLHDRDVLHRDIKPSNILIARSGDVKLADFGLARFTDSTVMTEDGAVVGTLQFMAPELLLGGAATPASEMWSLGCVLYVMLTGRMHVDATGSVAFARSVVNDPIRPPGMLAPDLPSGVSHLALALLEKEPALRLGRAAEVAARCEALLEKYRAPAAEAILKPGLLEDIGVWRAQPAEAAGVERTVALAPSAVPREPRPVRARPPARRRAWPALGAAAALAALFALAPRRTAPVAAPSPVASAPASAPAPAPPRWHVPAAYFEPLRAGGAAAARAAADLAATHPVPLGSEPAVWLHAYRLAVWFSDRARPALPPHLAGESERTITPLAQHLVEDQIMRAAKTGPPGLLSFAIRMVANYPDDPRSWLVLGRGLERFESPDEASVAYRKGLDLLGTASLEDGGPTVWEGLGGALSRFPPPDLETRWFAWLGARKSRFYSWGALREALEKRDPALYARMLERGATDPVSAEAAGYYLGVRQAEVQGEYPKALATWQRALEAAPASRVLIAVIVDFARAHGDQATLARYERLRK